MNRRQYLVTIAAVGVAGCTESDEPGDPAGTDGTGGSADSDGGGSTATATAHADQSALIDQPPAELLPSIDAFGAGWRESSGDAANETRFLNLETEDLIVYRIAVHDSVEAARNAYQSRIASIRERGIGMDAVDIGDEAALYTLAADVDVIVFRERNVLARVQLQAGPIRGDADIVPVARRLVRSLRDT